MANHASAEKRNRQRIKRTARNRAVSSAVRTFVKKVRTAITAKDKTAAIAALMTAGSELDRAASKGVVHPKAAARTISRLSIAVAKLGK
ncbi:MAG: 30S ribosomal protein S20 [Polyangiales bacterium]